MELTQMTKEQIADRLEAVKLQLEKYYTPQTDLSIEDSKKLNARAYDTLIAERDRLTRALA